MHRECADFPLKPTVAQRHSLLKKLLDLGATVPCSYCGKNWVELWNSTKETMFELAYSRDSAFQMMYDLHNVWNVCLNKPIFPWKTMLHTYGLPEHTPYEPTPLMTFIKINFAHLMPATCDDSCCV